MAITKETNIEKIELVGKFRHVQVKYVTKVTEDGSVIATKNKRETLAPGSDVTGKDAEIQAICAVAWTPEIVAAYQAEV